MRGRLLALLIAALALPAPHLVAHGNEFLFARVSPGDGGAIVLELTADYGGDALIADEAEARRVLAEALSVRIEGRLHRLEQLGTLTWERRATLSDDAPLPSGTVSGPHQLLTAVWRARLPGQTIVLVTPERTPHDVILWHAGDAVPEGQSRWSVLICGERSRPIVLAAAPPGLYWKGMVLGALLPAILVWCLLRGQVGKRNYGQEGPGLSPK